MYYLAFFMQYNKTGEKLFAKMIERTIGYVSKTVRRLSEMGVQILGRGANLKKIQILKPVFV